MKCRVGWGTVSAHFLAAGRARGYGAVRQPLGHFPRTLATLLRGGMGYDTDDARPEKRLRGAERDTSQLAPDLSLRFSSLHDALAARGGCASHPVSRVSRHITPNHTPLISLFATAP